MKLVYSHIFLSVVDDKIAELHLRRDELFKSWGSHSVGLLGANFTLFECSCEQDITCQGFRHPTLKCSGRMLGKLFYDVENS